MNELVSKTVEFLESHEIYKLMELVADAIATKEQEVGVIKFDPEKIPEIRATVIATNAQKSIRDIHGYLCYFKRKEMIAVKRILSVLIVVFLICSVALADTIVIKDMKMSEISTLISNFHKGAKLYYPTTSKEAFEGMNYYAVIARVYIDIRNEVPDWKFVYKPNNPDRYIAYIGYSYSSLNNTNDVIIAYYYGNDKYYIAGYNYTTKQLYLITDGPYSEEQIITLFEMICGEYRKYKSEEIVPEVNITWYEYKDKYLK